MKESSLKEFMDDENWFDFQSYQEHAIKALKEGKPLLGKDGIATPLIKKIIEAALEGELDAHIAETKVQANRRNRSMAKTVQSSTGSFELDTPRDRQATFEPELVKKRQTFLTSC